MYPKSCIVCGATIPEPLYEFGDLQFPLCQSCWLTPTTNAWEEAIYEREYIVVDDKIAGHHLRLTAFGVAFFDGNGSVGSICATVYYPKQKEETNGDSKS